MKISLLRTLVAAFALCMAVPGQAAMGNAGSGGEPGVQQEVSDEVEFISTPPSISYVSTRSSSTKDYINFEIKGYTSDMYVRFQFDDATTNDVSLSFYNIQSSAEGTEKLELDDDNGAWIEGGFLILHRDPGVPYEYVNFHGDLSYTTFNNFSYTVSVYSSKDTSTPALATSKHEVVFIEDRPSYSLSTTRLSGDLNTDIPLQITVDPGDISGAEGFQISIEPQLESGEATYSFSEGEFVLSEEGSYTYDIPSLQNKTYTFTMRAISECRGKILFRIGQDGGDIYLYEVNVAIPITFSQSDIDALKAIANANPMSTDLQKFIEDKYYEKDYNSADGYRVGVSWNTENPSRVSEFILDDSYYEAVDTLDLSALTALERIQIYNSRIRKLDLSSLTNLNSLGLRNTKLKWTDVVLPSPLSENFYISGNTYIEATGAVPVDDYNAYAYSGVSIDLSAYANVNGTQSTYQWYKVTREPSYESTPVNMTGSNGKFTLTGTPGEYYYCEITNPLYGNWWMRTQEIKISRTSNNYSPIDTLALRKLAEDNPQVPQLKEFVDSKGWEHENWDTYSDAISTDWTNTAPYRLTHLRFRNLDGSISKLDLSAFTELVWFDCSYMNISEMDLSNNMKLEYLDLSADIPQLDLSNNRELNYLYLSASNLVDLNIANCTKLETIRLPFAKLSSIDLSVFTQLKELSLEYCRNLEAKCLESIPNVEILSLRGTTQFGDYIQGLPSSIQDLDLSDTEYPLPSASYRSNLSAFGLPRNIDSIDFNEYPKLQRLDVGSESTLKYSGIKNFRSGIDITGSNSFIPLVSSSHPEDPDLFENGDTIDLFSEAVINGVNSQYIWVNAKDRTEETEAVKAVEGKPGVFVLDSKEEKYGEYFCIIWNTQFCRSVEINSWSGWRLETSTFRVNTLTPELFDQRDVQVIADIVAASGDADMQNWWDNDSWMDEDITYPIQVKWNNEKPHRLTELTLWSGTYPPAETIDVSALDRLEVFALYNYHGLKNVILPEETSRLRSLTIRTSSLESLVVSPYTELEILDLSNTSGLTTCDVSNNTKLETLRLDGTYLEGIEVSNPQIASQLTVYGVPDNVTLIDLNEFPVLKQLYPGRELRFSGVQNPRQMEPLDDGYNSCFTGTIRNEYTPYGATMSFPEEMNIGGVTSTISWSQYNLYTGEEAPIDAGNSYIIGNDLEPSTIVSAHLENSMFPRWEMVLETYVYTCDGDANLDRLVNVADVTATVSYILWDQENMVERFGWAEADVNYDNYVDVADVTGIVNIIQGKPVTKASELRDAYLPTVLLELDDKGFLSMTSQVPVAGIQLEFTGATKEIPLLSDAAHLVQASTLNGDTLRTLGYSMDGKTIPAGKTVIMQLPAGVKLLKAVFSDAEANSLKAEGDIVPTGIESIQTADQIEAVLNYPNPFSGSTTFSYNLKEQAQSVAIQIFSTSGALVETIEGLPASVGTNRYTTSVQLPGGIYYYRLLLDGKKVSEANTMMIK